MKRLYYFLLLIPVLSYANNMPAASDSFSRKPLLSSIVPGLQQIWNLGNTELYFTGYAWHNRYTYERERVGIFNELAFGGGVGKSFYDEQGDWHGLYAFAFLESHKKIEPVVGYAFLKMVHWNDAFRAGAGYTVLLTSRTDIMHGVPFPGILPWISVGFKQASISATYVPGSKNAGNVLFVIGKWTFCDNVCA